MFTDVYTCRSILDCTCMNAFECAFLSIYSCKCVYLLVFVLYILLHTCDLICELHVPLVDVIACAEQPTCVS